MRTLYIECAMGAAGDMLLGALYELLEDKEGFLAAMNGLGLPGVHLEGKQATTCGISGTHMEVTVHGLEEDHHHDHPHGHEREHEHEHPHAHDHEHDHGHHHPHEHDHEQEHHHATPDHIAGLIDTLPISDEVKTRARAVYDAIAQAEAKAHGCPVGEVHYHEVGALDAVADVVGVCYALSLFRPDQIVVSPIHVGCGTVRCAHGVMPVPAPATAHLLSNVPIYGGEVSGELCTPTGAALLVEMAHHFGPMPPMKVQKVGYGVGSRTFDRPNCVRAFWGESAEETGEIVELVCNLDDMSPEALAFAAQRLLEQGALDVYTTPGTMKKGRAGQVLTVLCEPERMDEMARHILSETTTNGLRVRRCGKYFLTPKMGQVQTPWGAVGCKTAEGFGITHVKPEHEDVAALARAKGLPYETVWQAARQGEKV